MFLPTIDQAYSINCTHFHSLPAIVLIGSHRGHVIPSEVLRDVGHRPRLIVVRRDRPQEGAIDALVAKRHARRRVADLR